MSKLDKNQLNVIYSEIFPYSENLHSLRASITFLRGIQLKYPSLGKYVQQIINYLERLAEVFIDKIKSTSVECIVDEFYEFQILFSKNSNRLSETQYYCRRISEMSYLDMHYILNCLNDTIANSNTFLKIPLDYEVLLAVKNLNKQLLEVKPKILTKN